jgi:succinyl-diaminopimelate desuccinylase
MPEERVRRVADRVHSAVYALSEEMTDFLAELIRIPTVNPPGDCYAGCASLLEQTYRRLGYEVQRIEAVGMTEHSEQLPRVNVLARRGSGRQTLHFNGHFDVVPPGDGWTVPPFAGLVRDGRLYGRGTADQKAGIAASLFAVEALRRSGLEPLGVVEQSATVDEESGGFAGVALLCRKRLIDRGLTDYVIITEPLGHDRICLGHRGVYWFEVVAHGRSAHGSMPGLGLNAADLLIEFVTRVNHELKPRLARRVTTMPVEPELARRPTINLNSLHGGQLTDGLQTPCVPDRCSVVYDRRYIVEENLEQVQAEIRELVESANSGSEGRLELRDLMIVEPVETARDAPLVRELSGAIQLVTGQQAQLIASPGTYDQKHVQRIANVEQCVAYGPGILELAHQPDEYVDLEHLRQSATVMALTTIGLLGWSER